jgi:hypothetical protein
MNLLTINVVHLHIICIKHAKNVQLSCNYFAKFSSNILKILEIVSQLKSEIYG